MGGDDPFDDLVLDESFVRAAERSEPSAAERLAEARYAEAMLRVRPSVVVAPRSRRGPLRLVVGVFAAAALLFGMLHLADQGPLSIGGDDRFVLDGRASRYPSPPADLADRPLSLAPIVPDGGSHSFVRVGADGEPVRWDPCRPIRLVVSGQHRVGIAADLLAEATAIVSAASGLQFVVEGETDEAPGDEARAPVQDRYGDRWAPVLVAWTDPSVVPTLKGDVMGLAGAQPISPPRSEVEVFVTGSVHLDAPAISTLATTPAGQVAARSILVHELGHLVGLDHVEDPGELMFKWTNVRSELGPGDRVGLAELGRGPCVPDL